MMKNYTLAEIKAICEAHKVDECEKCEIYDICMSTFQNAPEHWQIDSRELVKVVHAHWIPKNEYFSYCSNCDMEVIEVQSWFRYCPNCGAKMDAERSYPENPVDERWGDVEKL